MKLPRIKDYIDKIEALPLKKKYTKEDLLTPEFLIEAQGPIEIYYVTHNEHMNPKAKVFIVGITPGFEQMNTSIVAAKQALEAGVSLEDLPYLCKKQGRLSGAIRKNTIEMLNDLGLPAYLGLEHAGELFETRDELLHTTSVIPFAVFVKGKNYTGHSPDLMKSELLMSYVKAFFEPQVALLGEALIIPLGRCVEKITDELIKEGKLKETHCLKGFPHPSGANVNRKKQFEEEKPQMQEKLKLFFEEVIKEEK